MTGQELADKLCNSKEPVEKVTPQEFQDFAGCMNARVEQDNQGCFITVFTSWGRIQVRPSE